MQQQKLVAKHMYSSKASPFSGICYMHFKVSDTWLPQCIFHMVTYHRRVFYGRHGRHDLHKHKEHLPPVTLSQTLLLLAHCPCQPAAAPAVCQGWECYWPETQPQKIRVACLWHLRGF